MLNQLKDNSKLLSSGAAAAGARNETDPTPAAITMQNTNLDAGVMPQRSFPTPSLYPNHHTSTTPESTAIELTLSLIDSNEIVSHIECLSEVELNRTNSPESTISLECLQVDPSLLEEHECIVSYDVDFPIVEVKSVENNDSKEKMQNEPSPQISKRRSDEASQLRSSPVPPSAPKKTPSLPVELHYLGKKKITPMKREAIMGMKEQLAEDDYLRKLCIELQLLQYDRTLTTADRYRRLRAKQNEILYYRNQDMVAEFYNGRVVKNNGSDFIMLPGNNIPKNLPDGFTFGLRGSADENGKRDVLLIQKIKEVHGL